MDPGVPTRPWTPRAPVRIMASMLDTFRPLLEAAQGLDLEDSEAARAELSRRLDPASDAARAVGAELVKLYERGELAQNGAPPVRWGRVTKASEESLGFSIDVVVMDGAGPKHRHPEGEVNFCVALDGAPTFDGRPAGWVVMPKDSTHVPTVAGGTMLIAYLLPQGAIEFLEKPS